MKNQGKFKVIIDDSKQARLKAQENLSKVAQGLPLSLGSIKVIKE